MRRSNKSRIFTAEDWRFQDIPDRSIAVIGCRNQGRAQALNLRDGGLRYCAPHQCAPHSCGLNIVVDAPPE